MHVVNFAYLSFYVFCDYIFNLQICVVVQSQKLVCRWNLYVYSIFKSVLLEQELIVHLSHECYTVCQETESVVFSMTMKWPSKMMIDFVMFYLTMKWQWIDHDNDIVVRLLSEYDHEMTIKDHDQFTWQWNDNELIMTIMSWSDCCQSIIMKWP